MEDIRCMVYIGMPDNPQFLGALKPADVAKKINESRGPSGENREYLLQLEAALETLSPDSGDKHVSDLARRVRAMEPLERETRIDEVTGHPLHKVGSTEEQEEIEKD
jgi:cation transport protein ChaC